MGLFDKKYCDICGDKIGLLGNRKLEDGNLCKKCAAKLSPWFSERRHSTVQEIREQLDYRERNQNAVAAFHTTRSLGKYYCLLLDEEARKFIVTRARDIAAENPDVLDYSQAIGCELDIDENKSELKENKDGKSVSYNPPRYEYSYMFYATIKVNHPYFDEMRFALNSSYVRTGERCMSGSASGWRINLADTRAVQGANEYQEYVRLGNEIREAVEGMYRAPAEAAAAPAEIAAGSGAFAAGAAGAAAGLTSDTPAPGMSGMDAETIALAEQQAAQLKAQMEAAGIDMEAYRAAHKALENGDPGPLQAIMKTINSLPAAAMGAAGAGTATNAEAALVKCPWCGQMTPPGGQCGYCGGPLDG